MKSKKPSDEDLAFIKTQVKMVWVDGLPRFERLVSKYRPVLRMAPVHMLAGTIANGYRKLNLPAPNGKRVQMQEHNLVWYNIKGEWPTLEIDHHDGNRLNNHPDNLRLATHRQNSTNKPMLSNNTSGLKGVSHRPDCTLRPWHAKVYAQGKGHSKFFPTKEEAYEWRCQKAIELHGEFAHA